MKSKNKISLILVSLFILAGCNNSKEAIATVEAAPTFTPISSEEREAEVNPTEEKVEILDFVDAHENSYQVEVNPRVIKNEYKKDLFVHDGEKLYYEDEKYTSRLGIDVSKHQGTIDWEKVKADGYEFAILRIGYRGYGESGTLRTDEKFYEYLEGAKEVGLDVGVYFFSQAINEEEAIEEAKLVIDILNGYKLDMPIVYDPESILHTTSRTDNVTGEQFTKNTKAFCDFIVKEGYETMIYSNMLWQAFQLDLEYLSDFTIWYADYEPIPQTPYNFTIWQYTEEGQVDGIDGNCDINIQLIPLSNIN